MNRKLRCSKRQAKKIGRKIADGSIKSIFSNHWLTAREILFIDTYKFRNAYVYKAIHKLAMSKLTGIIVRCK